MRGMRLFCLAFLVVASAAVVRADIQIPVMDVSDPPCYESCPNPVGNGQGFTFTTDSSGGGIFKGTNTSMNAWTSLLFTFSALPSGWTVNCTSSGDPAPFQTPCTQKFDDSGNVVGLLFLCGAGGGIGTNEIFTINLNDAIFHWPVGMDFTALPNEDPNPPNGFVHIESVPEPATFTLVGIAAGLVALLGKRKVQSEA